MADQLPEYQLTPQARPTDQFIRPGIRKSAAGQQLLQVAGALKDFNSTLEPIYDRRFQAYQQASQMQADQISATHQDVYKNQDDLKAAVDRGDIPQHANPWLMVRLKQDVARNEATSAQAGIYNDLRQDKAFHSDSPQAVSDFINQRFAKLSQGRDAWQIAAMQPTVQQAHTRMMQDWSEQRGQERLNEARTASGAAVLQSVNDRLGGLSVIDPEAADKMPAMISDMQQQYDEMTRVVDKATASKWLSDAAFQAGKIHRSADLTRTILDGVKGQDGLQLSKLADNKAQLETLPREIEQLSLADVRTTTELRQQQAVKEAQNLLDKSKQWMKEQGVANLFQVKVPKDVLEKESPMVMNEYNKLISASAADFQEIKNTKFIESLDPVTQQAFKQVASGEMTTDQYMKFGTVMSLYGEPGRTALEGLTRIWLQQRGIAEGVTKPESLSRLNKAAESGTLTTDMVMQSYQNRELDHNDVSRYLGMAAQVQAEGGKSNPAVQETLQQITHQVEAPFLQQGVLRGEQSQMEDKVNQAKAAFLNGYYNDLVKRPDWANLSITEQHKQIEELRDTIAKSSGGFTQDQWLKGIQTPKKPEPINTTPTLQPAQQAMKKAAGDPLTIDSGTVQSLGKMLHFDVEKPPLHEMVKWSETNRDPLGDGVSSGQNLLDRVKEYRTKQNFLTDKAYVKVDMDGGFVGGSRLGYLAMQAESKHWSAAMDSLQALKPVVEQAQSKLQQITDQFNKTGKISFEQQQEARQLTLQYLSFLDLRKNLGYTPEEVKAMGDGAWRQAPMFANPVDLKARGEAVAKKLGIQDFQFTAFAAAQLQLMQQMRGNRTENNGEQQ